MTQDNKPFIIIASAGVIFVVIVIVMIVLYFSDLNKSSMSVGIKISNYDTYVKNLSSDERDAIEAALYSTVSLNNSDSQELKNIKDATIRESTYEQTYEKNIYSTGFIVDIESIKQSYKIKDLYSKLPVERSGLHDYTSLALCLEKKDLIYGEFKCQDRLSQEAGVSQSDPILQYLPVSTLTFSIKQDLSSGTLKLIGTVYLSEVDYRLGKDAAIASYKNEIRKWFTSKGLDINKYSITYVVE